MKYKVVCFVFSFIAFFIRVEALEKDRQENVQQLLLAFQLQSSGNSYLDSYKACIVYNSAESELLKMGEPKYKIDAIRNLWIWYRIHGYSSGVILKPVQCPDEQISNNRYVPKPVYGQQIDFQQQHMIRDFLFGVGGIISGIFCITVNPPIGGKFGEALIAAGVGYMWNSINALITDSQEKKARLLELEQIQKQAESAAKKE